MTATVTWGEPRTMVHALGTLVRCRPHCWANIGSFGVNSVTGGRQWPTCAAGDRNGMVSKVNGELVAADAPCLTRADAAALAMSIAVLPPE